MAFLRAIKNLSENQQPSIIETINDKPYQILCCKTESNRGASSSQAYRYYAVDLSDEGYINQGTSGTAYKAYRIDPDTGELMKETKGDKPKLFAAKIFNDVMQFDENEAKLFSQYYHSEKPVQFNDQIIFVMDYLPGNPLCYFIRQNNEEKLVVHPGIAHLDFIDRMKILQGVMQSFNLMHHTTTKSKATIHSDIKGENIHGDFNYVRRENSCELLLAASLPNQNNIDSLGIKTEAAYIRVKNDEIDKLFYVNKETNECKEIIVSKEKLQEFDDKLKPTDSAKILSEKELRDITAITWHGHGNLVPNIYQLDFGSAKELDEENRGLKQFGKGEVTGSLFYLPPEAALNRLDIKSDIYSLVPIFAAILGADNPFSEKFKHRFLSQIASVPFNYHGMFTGNAAINLNLPYDIKSYIYSFLDRMQDPEYSKRPNSDEVLSFINSLLRLCISFKNHPEDKDNLTSMAAKLALMANGLWQEKSILIKKLDLNNNEVSPDMSKRRQLIAEIGQTHLLSEGVLKIMVDTSLIEASKIAEQIKQFPPSSKAFVTPINEAMTSLMEKQLLYQDHLQILLTPKNTNQGRNFALMINLLNQNGLLNQLSLQGLDPINPIDSLLRRMPIQQRLQLFDQIREKHNNPDLPQEDLEGYRILNERFVTNLTLRFITYKNYVSQTLSSQAEIKENETINAVNTFVKGLLSGSLGTFLSDKSKQKTIKTLSSDKNLSDLVNPIVNFYKKKP